MSIFNKLFGIEVTETPETIIVSGINGRDLGKFITKVWNTSVLEKYMFKRVVGGRFGRIEFYKFFTLDVVYMLEKMANLRNPRIPSRTLNQIVQAIKENTWFKDVENKEKYKRLDFTKLTLFNFKPKDFQQGWLEYYQHTPSAYRLKGGLLNATPGSGKGLPLETNVKVPNGWKKIKDLKVGDWVNTPKGGKAKVTHIFDNKNMECYEIIFEDGRKAVCDIEHLWDVYVYKCDRKSTPWRLPEDVVEFKTVNMKELIRLHEHEGVCYIPTVSHEKSADKYIKKPILLEHPEKVIDGSVYQRKERVKELIGDIFNINDGNYIYKTPNKEIINELIPLLYSLGCVVNQFDEDELYGIEIMLPNKDYEGYNNKLGINYIRKVENQDTRCIKIDDPDELFIIDNYIVTHNTFMTLATQELAGVDKVIVVCPKNAIDRVWFIDPNKFYKSVPKIWSTAMSHLPSPDTKIYIYHYEALDKALEHHLPLFKTNKFKYGLVLDECHNLNDVKSQRTQAWIKLCQASGSQNIIHASGTPFKSMGSEIIPLMRVIDPMFTPQVEEAFKKIYGSSASKGLDIIKNRLGLVSYVVTKEQLGLDKPVIELLGVKIPNGHEFTLTKVREAMAKFIQERVIYYRDREEEDLAFYRECLDIHEEDIGYDIKRAKVFKYYIDCVKRIQQIQDLSLLKEEISFCKKYEFNDISASLPREYVKDFRSVCSVIKYLKLKIQGECLGQVVGRMRIQAHEAMVANVPFRDICQSTKKKTLVFTSFVEVLETAMNKCKEEELNPILVYGKTNNNLSQLVSTFEKDPRVNPLIATYNSLSTAVPLTMADTMIMLNAPFRAYIQEQAISRIHRLNQDTQTKVYQCYLDTGDEPNISSRSLDIMKWSQEQVEAMTGVKSPYTISDEDGEVKISEEAYHVISDDLGFAIKKKKKKELINVENTIKYISRISNSGFEKEINIFFKDINQSELKLEYLFEEDGSIINVFKIIDKINSAIELINKEPIKENITYGDGYNLYIDKLDKIFYKKININIDNYCESLKYINKYLYLANDYYNKIENIYSKYISKGNSKEVLKAKSILKLSFFPVLLIMTHLFFLSSFTDLKIDKYIYTDKGKYKNLYHLSDNFNLPNVLIPRNGGTNLSEFLPPRVSFSENILSACYAINDYFTEDNKNVVKIDNKLSYRDMYVYVPDSINALLFLKEEYIKHTLLSTLWYTVKEVCAVTPVKIKRKYKVRIFIDNTKYYFQEGRYFKYEILEEYL